MQQTGRGFPRKVIFFFPLFASSDRNISHTSSTASPAAAGEPLDAGPDSTNLIWRVLLDDRINPDELLINISTNQLLTEADPLFSSEVGPVEAGPSSLEDDSLFSVNQTMEFTLRKRNDSGDGSYQNKTVQSGARATSRTNRTRYSNTSHTRDVFESWSTSLLIKGSTIVQTKQVRCD